MCNKTHKMLCFLYMYTNSDMEWSLAKVESCYTRTRPSLWTLFMTLFVICHLKHYFGTKRIIIHKYYRVKPVISVPVLQHYFKITFISLHYLHKSRDRQFATADIYCPSYEPVVTWTSRDRQFATADISCPSYEPVVTWTSREILQWFITFHFFRCDIF